MSDGTNTLQFFENSVYFNGIEYWYVYNAQNDVIGLINASGEYVVEYTYSAYGMPLSKMGTMADTLGTLNPFRYRGYIYDEETGLYYVSSRYYDPVVGRWLNADEYASTGQGILGHNMFVYCLNNSVNYLDIEGTDAVAIQQGWTASMWWLCVADTTLPVGDVIYVGVIAVLGIAVLVEAKITISEIPLEQGKDENIEYYKEHTKNRTPSNRNKHDKGNKRRNTDQGGEKKDSRMTPRNGRRNRPQNNKVIIYKSNIYPWSWDSWA